MNKIEFLDELRSRLSGLPVKEVEERLSFYGEMIDDCIEEGLSEEEAIKAIGSVDEICDAILEEIPLVKIAKEKVRSGRRKKAWEITLLALGAPIWAALLISAFSVLLSLYAVLWSLVAVCWAIFGALAGSGVGGVTLGIVYICTGRVFPGIGVIGMALVVAGLSVFMFFASLWAVKGAVWITKMIVRALKRCFVGKEKANA